MDKWIQSCAILSARWIRKVYLRKHISSCHYPQSTKCLVFIRKWNIEMPLAMAKGWLKESQICCTVLILDRCSSSANIFIFHFLLMLLIFCWQSLLLGHHFQQAFARLLCSVTTFVCLSFIGLIKEDGKKAHEFDQPPLSYSANSLSRPPNNYYMGWCEPNVLDRS